jgi:branched-chain amino acid transport system ATP-binding protein
MKEQDDMSAPIALECRGLTKNFGGLTAVDNISIKIKAGERRAILGPNGAGKTTFFRLISGEIPATHGNVLLYGQDITKLPCYRRTHQGLGRTFQVTNLFPTLSVSDNLLLAVMGLKRTKFSMLRPLSFYDELHDTVDKLLEKVGMIEKSATIIENLSHGEHRQIEIAMALISNPKVVLLDEPMAGLSSAESIMMTEIVNQLDRDITILIIEHDMDAAFQIADQISVLHLGGLFAEGAPEEIRTNPQVQKIYFGEG